MMLCRKPLLNWNQNLMQTNYMLFSKSRKNVSADVPGYSYLGIWMDEKLFFRKHID